jgi:hypothetical protein
MLEEIQKYQGGYHNCVEGMLPQYFPQQAYMYFINLLNYVHNNSFCLGTRHDSVPELTVEEDFEKNL